MQIHKTLAYRNLFALFFVGTPLANTNYPGIKKPPGKYKKLNEKFGGKNHEN